ncbi:myb-like protein X [Tribolium madens]|uniref:myb-like protein X n=1 Tax=Tribolium madens TaxID=41895 RepID=UPI001CF73834|nr:myb-like protein X [Tribolium madens]
MAVLKILFLFLLHIWAPNSVFCEPTEDYYYSMEDEPNSVNFTHVRAKKLSGNVQLTSLEVLPTDMLNNGFEKVEETTKVISSVNKHIGTIIENQQQDSLLSEVRTKVPTDGLEPLGLMDVFNDTSGTLPDQTTTEKLITDTPLNSEITEKFQDWVSGDLSLISTVRNERINSVYDERVSSKSNKSFSGEISGSEEIENLSTFLVVDEELLNEHNEEEDVEGEFEDIRNILRDYEESEEKSTTKEHDKTEIVTQKITTESITNFTEEKEDKAVSTSSTFTTDESFTSQNNEALKQTTVWTKFDGYKETTTEFSTRLWEDIFTEKHNEMTQKEENSATATYSTTDDFFNTVTENLENSITTTVNKFEENNASTYQETTTQFEKNEDFYTINMENEERAIDNFLNTKTENITSVLKKFEQNEAWTLSTEFSTTVYENGREKIFDINRRNEEGMSTEITTEVVENITSVLKNLEETEVSTAMTEFTTTIFTKNFRDFNINRTVEILPEKQIQIVQNEKRNLATTLLYEKELEEIIDDITTTLNKYEENYVLSYEKTTTQFATTDFEERKIFDTTTQNEKILATEIVTISNEKQILATDKTKDLLVIKEKEETHILTEDCKENLEKEFKNKDEITKDENLEGSPNLEKTTTEIQVVSNTIEEEISNNSSEETVEFLSTTNFPKEMLSTTTEETKNEDFNPVSTSTNTTENEVKEDFLNYVTSGISRFFGSFFDSTEKQFEKKILANEDTKNTLEGQNNDIFYEDETKKIVEEDDKLSHFNQLEVEETYRNLNKFEEESTIKTAITTNLNLDDFKSYSKSPQLPSKADSLINSLEAPQLKLKINDQETKVIIKIITNDSSLYIPSSALVTFPSPNTVNITWKSSSFQNNSLQFVMGNSLRLVIVKGTEMYIHQTLIHENKFDVDTNLITLDDDVQIYFSNWDILRLDHRIMTEFSEMTSAKTNLAAKITGGCVGAFLVIAGVVYFVIKKLRGKKLNFKPNNEEA